MSDKSPKELDKLFQQGSEQYDFEYNAEAWEQMEGLLDRNDRRRYVFWWCFGILGLILLLVSLWFSRKDMTDTIPSNLTEQKTEQTSIPNKKLIIKQQNQQQLKATGSKKTTILDVDSSKKSALPGASKIIKNTQTQERELLEFQYPKTEDNQLNKSKINLNKKTKNTIKSPPIASPIYNKKTIQDTPSDERQSPKNRRIFAKLDNLTTFDKKINAEKIIISKLPILPMAMLDFQSTNLRTPNFQDLLLRLEKINRVQKIDEILQKDKDALLLGLVLATELTSVGTDNFSKLSWKVGGQIEYRYKGKYSTSIGAVFSRKSYIAGEGEYIPPKGFWTRGVAPQSTDGICNILEVPIMVGYYPKGYFKNGFYANVGLTSYIMLWEWYGYSYGLPDKDLINEWVTEEDSQYWLGIGQISFGYNHLIGQKTSFQLEPYLQIPLTGVGHGNVKLWGMGVNMKINFQIK